MRDGMVWRDGGGIGWLDREDAVEMPSQTGYGGWDAGVTWKRWSELPGLVLPADEGPGTSDVYSWHWAPLEP
jgi:hypothetical protein